jgi:hypothetical protein
MHLSMQPVPEIYRLSHITRPDPEAGTAERHYQSTDLQGVQIQRSRDTILLLELRKRFDLEDRLRTRHGGCLSRDCG